MRGNLRYGLKVAGVWLIAIAFFCLSLSYATVSTAIIMLGVIRGLGMSETWSWWHWLVFSPPIYIVWLGAYFIGCAIDLQAWRLLFGYRKHRRVTTSNGLADQFQFNLMLMNYTRQKIIWNLPLVRVCQGFEGLRHMVLLAGSIRANVGRRSLLFGFMYDPDLTEIGEDVILGDGSVLTAHSMTTQPDGDRVFVTAPITIGPRTVIGGQARIDLGVRIGADAIVEPMSYVAPYTVIGDGEVWGGHPARFIRRREAIVGNEPIVCISETPILPIQTAETAVGDLGPHEETLRELVAHALGRPIDTITPTLSADHCAAWDSLGQLGIAAGLQRHFGISLAPQESFRLRSMSSLRQLLSDHPRAEQLRPEQCRAA